MKLKTRDKLFVRSVSIFLVGIFILTSFYPARAATPTPPESYELLYVVFNQSDPKTIGIELRNQTRKLDGSISALVSVRADNLIAYNLTFETTDPNNDHLETIDFLPLYPGHTYEIGTINLRPGEYFQVTATPFGMSTDEVRNKMTIVQLAILGMHLVGARPPTNISEGIETIPDAFDEVIGPIGAIAGLIKATMDIFETKEVSGETLVSLGDVLAEAPGGAEKIADLINLITNNIGVRYTGELIGSIFDAINVFNIIGNVKQAVDALGQLMNYPVYITATVTPAPEISQSVQRYQVLELNEPYQVDLAFKNTSFEIWESNKGYGLSILLEGIPFYQLSLNGVVGLEQIAQWSFQQQAFSVPGIYHIAYQMSYNGSLIGPAIPGEIVVVPEKSDSLKDLINGLVQDTIGNAGDNLEDYLQELELKIAQAIVEEIIQKLREICGGTGLYSFVGVAIYLNLRHSRRKQIRGNNKRGGMGL